jgi:GMP synthase (glutamine-hydrolysing)
VERWGLAHAEFVPQRHAGLIILGDSKHWATSRKYQRERAWLALALARQRPVLGICFGAQLMAAHLAGITNGRALANPPNNDHVGKVAPVEVRGAGLKDPVVASLRRSPLTTMFHEDCFQLPPGTTGLAWSTDTALEHCEAFRIGPPEDAVYGVQFHPEPTPEMLSRGWFKEVPDAFTLRTLTATGNSILAEWVRLAVGR